MYAMKCLWHCILGWEDVIVHEQYLQNNNSFSNKIQNPLWNVEIHFEIQKSTLKSRNPCEIQKSNLKSEIHVKSSGFRNLIRRDAPWRTPRPDPTEPVHVRSESVPLKGRPLQFSAVRLGVLRVITFWKFSSSTTVAKLRDDTTVWKRGM